MALQQTMAYMYIIQRHYITQGYGLHNKLALKLILQTKYGEENGGDTNFLSVQEKKEQNPQLN